MGKPSFFTDNGHVLISGITGSRDDMGGKTALANWWLCNPLGGRDLRIFYNAKGSSGVRGERVNSVRELAEKMAEGVRHFDFVPKTQDWGTPHERLQSFVGELPTSMSKAVVHDETPEYAEEDGSLAWFLKVGGQADGVFAANCKSLVLAQNPVDLSKTERTQTPTNVWVGPTSKDYKPYFTNNSYRNHYEFIVENHEPYQWTVMQGPRDSDRRTYEPVPAEYAGGDD